MLAQFCLWLHGAILEITLGGWGEDSKYGEQCLGCGIDRLAVNCDSYRNSSAPSNACASPESAALQ